MGARVLAGEGLAPARAAEVLGAAFGFAGFFALGFFGRSGRDARAGFFVFLREPLLDRVAISICKKQMRKREET